MGKIVIEANKRTLKLSLKEFVEYKDLLFFLVLRDVKVIYKQTILGFGWAILQPFVAMVIFTIFFGKLAGIEDDIKNGVPYAVFAYVALVPWTYFSSALTASANSLVGGAHLFSISPELLFP